VSTFSLARPQLGVDGGNVAEVPSIGELARSILHDLRGEIENVLEHEPDTQEGEAGEQQACDCEGGVQERHLGSPRDIDPPLKNDLRWCFEQNAVGREAHCAEAKLPQPHPLGKVEPSVQLP
jgi:hypothetical protein